MQLIGHNPSSSHVFISSPSPHPFQLYPVFCSVVVYYCLKAGCMASVWRLKQVSIYMSHIACVASMPVISLSQYPSVGPCVVTFDSTHRDVVPPKITTVSFCTLLTPSALHNDAHVLESFDNCHKHVRSLPATEAIQSRTLCTEGNLDEIMGLVHTNHPQLRGCSSKRTISLNCAYNKNPTMN